MGYDVGRAIDRWIEWLEEPREPDGMFHPSTMWGCTRKVVYELRGEPRTDEPAPEMRRVFRVGHLLHSFIQEAVSNDEGIQDSLVEVPLLDPRLEITGHADQLILDADGWLLLEYKTTKGLTYVRNAPKEDHVWQALTYMYILRKYGIVDTSGHQTMGPLGDALSRGVIFYLSKGADMEWVSHDIRWDDDVEDAIVALVAQVRGYLASGEMPERLPDQFNRKAQRVVRHPLCAYCPFVTTCWDTED